MKIVKILHLRKFSPRIVTVYGTTAAVSSQAGDQLLGLGVATTVLPIPWNVVVLCIRVDIVTVKVHCCVLELISRQILEQITTEEIIQYKTFQSEDLHQLYKT